MAERRIMPEDAQAKPGEAKLLKPGRAFEKYNVPESIDYCAVEVEGLRIDSPDVGVHNVDVDVNYDPSRKRVKIDDNDLASWIESFRGECISREDLAHAVLVAVDREIGPHSCDVWVRTRLSLAGFDSSTSASMSHDG